VPAPSIAHNNTDVKPILGPLLGLSLLGGAGSQRTLTRGGLGGKQKRGTIPPAREVPEMKRSM